MKWYDHGGSARPPNTRQIEYYLLLLTVCYYEMAFVSGVVLLIDGARVTGRWYGGGLVVLPSVNCIIRIIFKIRKTKVKQRITSNIRRIWEITRASTHIEHMDANNSTGNVRNLRRTVTKQISYTLGLEVLFVTNTNGLGRFII